MKLILTIVLFATAAFATPGKRQQRCVSELLGIKKENGKPELSETKIKATCEKNTTDKFLDCINGTRRGFQSIEVAVDFCAKKPTSAKQQCVKTLATYKNDQGKTSLSGKKLASACGKNSSLKFLDCIAATQRPLASMDTTLNFCTKRPTKGVVKCVQELSSYKSEGKKIATGERLAETCLADASDKFLDCIAREQSIGACKGGRLPASVKSKKSKRNS